MSTNFVDPSALSLPSPQSDAPDSPHPPHSDSTAGPSRKRARTGMTPDERKEARAHRNRIAAQNSRDKKKAQFNVLERRVAELEEENRQLRAGMTLSDMQYADVRRIQEQEREKARERENAELKERIKSLEKGWEAVVKVLAAQGLPTPAVTAESTPTSEPSPSPSNNSTTTFPVLVPSIPVFPITPSPSISGTSALADADEFESTRHLARVATTAATPPAVSLQRADFAPTPLAYDPSPSSPTDEAAVDAWIREICSGSPVSASAPSPELDSHGEESMFSYAAPIPSAAPLMESTEIASKWENGVEMQRLLDLFSMVQSDECVMAGNQVVDANTTLGLELFGGWNIEREPAPTSSGVGVF